MLLAQLQTLGHRWFDRRPVQFLPGAFTHFAQRRLFRIDELTEQFAMSAKLQLLLAASKAATSSSRIERQLSLG
jgi:hypothetical protein